ncbi:MAG TPA: YggS family pyridoxal phosphate-dependent enzyme [Geobacteraceae bacterium]|nr:YggS family pyridoxal phosphate-dependent enzyme [Geobacteraceae bacterium]
MSIATNLENIMERIEKASIKAGRDPKSVRLVAVTKTKPADAVIEAAQAGHKIFGENYVQELTAKAALVKEPVEWHFIGALQSNKVKYIAGLVTLIHSVDRLSLAMEIEKQWGKLGKICDILVEVNVSGEKTKAGTSRAEAMQLVEGIAEMPHLRIKGLMTMPPFFDEPELARPYFKELRELAAMIDARKITNVEMRELSMGMSGDFEAAIEEGATLVRVGSAIFGSR